MKSIKLIFMLALVLITSLVYSQSENLKRIEVSGQVIFEDDEGNVVETRNVDENGNLINNEQGHSIVKWKFDKKGNKLEQAYYDKNGNLTVDNLGVAIWKFKYDKNNNKIYQGHFGADGKLLPPNENK